MLRAGICLVVDRMGSLCYTPRPGICLVFRREESFSYTPRAAVCLVVKRVGRLSYTSPVGICFVVRREGSISYTPRTSMCLAWGWWGVSLTRPVIESLLFVWPHHSACGAFLLHTPCWNLSGLSSDGEALFEAVYWNLSHRWVGG